MEQEDISKLRKDYVIVSTIILVAMTAAVGLQAKSLWTTLQIFPYYGTPLIVTMFLMYQVNYTWPLFTLYVSSLLYGTWFAYAYYLFLSDPPDALNGVIVLATGILSLPVMVPLWGLAIFLHLYKKNWNKTALPKD